MPYGVMTCKLHAIRCLPLRLHGLSSCAALFALAGTGLSGKALPFSSFTNGLRSRAFDALHPPLPPRPFTPAGVKGSWDTQFCFFGLERCF